MLRHKWKTSLVTLVGSAVFLAGLTAFLYPAIAGFASERAQTRAIAAFDQAAAAMQAGDKAEALRKAEVYNRGLLQHQSALKDPFGTSVAAPGASASAEATQVVSFAQTGTMLGSVEIPRIGIKAPIYEGTSEEVLQKGVGWLAGTSLPVGGESTNTVLCAHTGLPTARLFTDLGKLEAGDIFFIRNLHETLAYRVYDTRIVEPEDTELLEVTAGRDRATLLTCYPYMINSQRLLVLGQRTSLPAAQAGTRGARGKPVLRLSAATKDLLCAALIVLGLLIVFGLVIWVPRRRKSRKQTGGAP